MRSPPLALDGVIPDFCRPVRGADGKFELKEVVFCWAGVEGAPTNLDNLNSYARMSGRSCNIHS